MVAVVCPTVVGRSRELAELAEWLSGARSGDGVVAIVSGEAGIGKSRLVTELAERARAGGYRVLWGRCTDAGVPIAFRPLAEALQSGLADGELDALVPDRDRAFVRTLIDASSAPARDPSLLARMAALRRLLVALADDTVAVLVVEDLHWADQDTLEVVEYLADNLRGTPVVCVCTHRSYSGGPVDEVVSGLAARRAVRLLSLERLDETAVEEMARSCVGVHNLPLALVELLTTRAAGVPFLVEELVAAYLAGGGPQAAQHDWWVSRRIAQALPGSYRALVAARLAGLEDDARAVAHAASVVGCRVDAPLLGVITELDERRVYEGLRAGVAARLLTASGEHYAATFEFRHALSREAVLAELLPHERAALALRAGRAIELTYPGVPGDWCVRAADLLEQGGDTLGAVRLLQESARRALNRSALASAEVALLRARDLCRDDWMVWMGVDQLLLDAYARAGRADRVVEIGGELIAAFEGRYGRARTHHSLAAIHLRVARGCLPSAQLRLARTHLEAARQAAVATNNGVLEARAVALEATLALEEGDADRAQRLADRALADSHSGSLTDVVCEALAVRAAAAARSGDLGAARTSLAELLDRAVGPDLALARVAALAGRAASADVEEDALDRWLEARDLAVATGAVSALVGIDLGVAWCHLDRADTDAARPAVDDALEGARLTQHALLNDALAAVAALHALRAGAPAAGARVPDHAPLSADHVRDLEALTRALRELVDGNDGNALQSLRDLSGNTADLRGGWCDGLLAFLAATVHRDPEPAQLVRGRVALDRVTRAYLGYADAAIAAASGRVTDAADRMGAADQLMPHGWRRHHARRLLADRALSDGWGDPITWASDALEFFEHSPLPRLADACRATLRRAGVRLRRAGRGDAAVPADLHRLGVTSREMDVLLLLGDRLTNREIGARLFVSPRTVETHVTNLQRKLGLWTRAELAETARRHASV